MAGRKKIAVVGAGPGGLTAAMLLASRGYDVDVYEKDDRVGGRNQSLTFDGFTFDTGPTFLMATYLLDEMFELAGRKTKDYLDIRSLDPFYRLVYGDGREFFPSLDRAAMRRQIEALFPGQGAGYDRYLKREARKFDALLPCLRIPYQSPADYVKPRLLKALPWLDAHVSLADVLGRYFTPEDLKISFTFQAKYLGMSPWKCPGTFSIISFLEHSTGVQHPIGGLNRISAAMAQVIAEDGGRIHLSTPVKEVVVERGRAVGLKLANGERVVADDVILNADFAYAMHNLVKPEHLSRWRPEKIARKGFSCSTFMLYLGMDKLYDVPHHSIVFAPDYRKNVGEIADSLVLSEDPSFYVQNACVTDPSLAPAGKSTLYVLVPIANNRSGIDWVKEAPRYREKVLDLMEKRAGITDVRRHIVAERMITPFDWSNRYNVHIGATFNLAHSIDQMLYFRPHNRFEEFDGCWLVGGGTHPGSGLPTIYESARISVEQILKRDGR